MTRQQRWFLVAVGIVSIIVVVQTFFDVDGWDKRARLRADVDRVRAENDAAQAKADALRHELDALRDRADVQQRVVREELGYVKPGDMVLTLDELSP